MTALLELARLSLHRVAHRRPWLSASRRGETKALLRGARAADRAWLRRSNRASRSRAGTGQARDRQAGRRGRQPRDRPGERRADWNSARDRVAWIHATYGGSRRWSRPICPAPSINVGVLALPEPAALPVAEVVYRAAGRNLADPDLRREVVRRLGRGPGEPRPLPGADRTRPGREHRPGWPSRRSRRPAAATMPGSIFGSTAAASR